MFTFKRDMFYCFLVGFLIPVGSLYLAKSGWLENLALLIMLVAVFLLAIWLSRSGKPK